jgi:carbon starvation protein
VWIIIMFIYTFIASRLPVWLLLQPRDYINSHQLFIALGITFIGVLVGFDRIVAPALRDNLPEGSPNIFPFLFITIACGAISGFHSLVSSGTTSKQLAKETDARYVGYMGAVGEGSLAMASVLAVTAGVAATQVEWEELYPDFATASGGAVGNFVNGIAAFANNLGVELGLAATFAAVVVISFAATTMDTGVRLQRYIVQEIATIIGWKTVARNLTLAGLIGIALPLFLALMPGSTDQGFAFGTLWRLFGTTNQLTAGLALAVIAVWVTRNRRNPAAALIPMAFLLVMTVWALIIQLGQFWDAEERWILVPLDVIILVLALWLIVEAVLRMRTLVSERRAGVTESGDPTAADIDRGDSQQ